jgi:putative hydrolase of the HAD superfamily
VRPVADADSDRDDQQPEKGAKCDQHEARWVTAAPATSALSVTGGHRDGGRKDSRTDAHFAHPLAVPARARIGASPPRAILLDALGTLVGLEPPWPAFERLLAERHQIALAPGAAQQAFASEMAYYRAHCARASDEGALLQLRHECAAVLARELDLTLASDDLVPSMLDALCFVPYADVEPALGRLRAQGVRLVVVSNWDISLHDVLARTGLRELLDGVVTSAEIGASKPAPEPFAAALELAGIDAAAALHVGDGLQEDLAGAQAAGIEAVLLVRNKERELLPGPPVPPPGTPAISSLAELCKR